MAMYLTNQPYTECGAKLTLTAEQEKNCWVVYQLEKDGKGAVFHSLWSEEGEYGDDCLILPVQSVYNGLSAEYVMGTDFANVEGSSHDTREDVYGSWIGLLRQEYRRAGEAYPTDECCAEGNVIYQANSNDTVIQDGFACGGRMVGGHVLINRKDSAEVDEGGNVELLPICNNHNTHIIRNLHRGTGAGYYMKLKRPMKAALLSRYFEPIPKRAGI